MPISAKPKLCYQSAPANVWTSAGTHGPGLSGGAYTAAPIGVGLDPESGATVASSPGISLSGALTVGGWRTIDAANEDADEPIFNIILDDGTKRIDFSLTPTGGNLVIAEATGPSASVAFAAGEFHWAAVFSGSTVQFYINGSAVGTAQAITRSASIGAEVQINAPIPAAGRPYQPFANDSAYSAGDIAYLYNSGSGVAYASMEVAAAASGAGSAMRRRLLMLEGSSWPR